MLFLLQSCKEESDDADKHREDNHGGVSYSGTVVPGVEAVPFAEGLCIQELHGILRKLHHLGGTCTPGHAQSRTQSAAESAETIDDEGKGLAVEPVGVQTEGRVWLHSGQEHDEGNGSSREYLHIAKYMRRLKGVIVQTRERQIAVQEVRHYTVEGAECRSDSHSSIHILRYLGHELYILVLTQEDEVAHLQSNGEECTDAGQLQQLIDEMMSCFVSGCNGNGLTDEAVEKRHTGDGEGCNEEAECNEWHLLCHSAQLIYLADTGSIDDGTGTHEEQGLEENIAEGVSGGTVQRHVGADADTADHEASLTDDMVAEQTAHIIFHDSVAGSVECHECTQPHEELVTGQHADKGIDGYLRGEGAHEYAAGDGAFRIGI